MKVGMDRISGRKFFFRILICFNGYPTVLPNIRQFYLISGNRTGNPAIKLTIWPDILYPARKKQNSAHPYYREREQKSGIAFFLDGKDDYWAWKKLPCPTHQRLFLGKSTKMQYFGKSLKLYKFINYVLCFRKGWAGSVFSCLMPDIRPD